MKKLKYILVPVLVTLIVLIVSLNPTASVTRKASAAPRAAVVTKYMMIPAAAFSITADGRDYYNYGNKLEVSSGIGSFVAPVYLPLGARIKLIKFFAKDSNLSLNVCASLNESYPKTGGHSVIGQSVCTTGSSGNQQPYKYNLETYAVMLKYTVNQ
jgi:hypothetical protein